MKTIVFIFFDRMNKMNMIFYGRNPGPGSESRRFNSRGRKTCFAELSQAHPVNQIATV